jgi:hypothetical protein
VDNSALQAELAMQIVEVASSAAHVYVAVHASGGRDLDRLRAIVARCLVPGW